MANWIIQRDKDGKQVALNLDAAGMIVPVHENGNEVGCRIVFPGDNEWTFLDRPFGELVKTAMETN